MKETIDDSIYQPLRWAFALVPFLAGLDKYFNLLTDWQHYLAPAFASLLPVSPSVFFGIVGVVEMAVGVMIMSGRWTRIGAWLASIWLVLIAINLLVAGIIDVAVRDVVLAIAAYTLGRLTELREAAPSERGARAVSSAAS